LLDFQRGFAANPPGGKRGAVLDGRDIGTVVCPDAPLKLYITASIEARADRRFKEQVAKGETQDPAAVLADLQARGLARPAAPPHFCLFSPLVCSHPRANATRQLCLDPRR
jgi:cytidylate kinase